MYKGFFIVDGVSPSGRLIVKKLSEIGHRVYYGIHPDEDAVPKVGLPATALPLDLGDDNSVAVATTGVLKAERRIDTVVNNWRSPLFGALEIVSPNIVETYLNETIIGMVRLQNSFLPTMRAQNEGRFVTITPRGNLANNSLRGWQRAVHAAENALMETLVHELEGTDINVDVIVSPLFERDNERPHNFMDKTLHMQAMPNSWGRFQRHIQDLFVNAPSAHEQSDRIVDVLINGSKTSKPSGGMKFLPCANAVLQMFGFGRKR